MKKLIPALFAALIAASAFAFYSPEQTAQVQVAQSAFFIESMSMNQNHGTAIVNVDGFLVHVSFEYSESPDFHVDSVAFNALQDSNGNSLGVSGLDSADAQNVAKLIERKVEGV